MRTAFGEFILDSETRQLLRGGKEIHLSPKAFDLLSTLVKRRPSVVPKDDLFSEIWPDTFVVEGNLNVLVSEIRRAMADNGESAPFIRTVHGVGYAFCAEATDLGRARQHEDAKPRCWLVWKNRTFALAPGDNVIGRDPDCAVWLDHAGVSRRHARIRITDDTARPMLDDLKSTNGTFVGGKQVTADTPLADEDIIKIGPVKLTFRARSAEPARTKRIRGR